jgi:hypothetical protein
VQVDFTLLNWPAQNFHTVRFAAPDLPQGPNGFDGVYRASANAEGYQMRTISGVVADIPAFDFSGKLRLVRTGLTISGYYWNGTQFVLLAASTTTSVNTGFVLDFSSPVPTSPVNVQIAFDNFKVNAGAAVCPSSPTSFDVVNDFSIASNPNGVWSYGYTAGLGGTFQLHTSAQLDTPPGIDRWYTPSIDPTVLGVDHNKTGATIGSTTFTYPPDMLRMHPTIPNIYDVVRWTAPQSGQYSIQGAFAGLDNITGVADTDVHVLLNSTAELNPVVVLHGNGTSAPIAITPSLNAGDTVDFTVGIGPSGAHQNDSTGLKVTISPAILAHGTMTINSNQPAATFFISPPVAGAPTTGPYPVTIPNVAAGTYTVTFNPLAGYIIQQPLPPTQALAAGGSISFTGTYIPTGSITVVSNVSSAGFQLAGPGTYHYNGNTPATIPNAPAGNYTITWNPLLGNITPASETKSLSSAGMSFVGNYISALVTSPLTLAFSYPKHTVGPIKPQLLTVASTGSAITFTVTTSTIPPGGGWLSVSKTSGTTATILGITVTPGLPAGSYIGSLLITAPNAIHTSVQIPVQLEVTDNDQPPVTVHSSNCINDICVSFQSLHKNTDHNKAIGVLNITNLTGAWYELRVDFSHTTAGFGNQAPPVIILAPYGSFITTTDMPIEFKAGNTLQLIVNKNELDAMGMFLIDLTLRAFFGVSFPTSSQGLLDFRLGVLPTYLKVINTACADPIASTVLAIRKHDTFAILTGTADVTGCIATNQESQNAIVKLIKLLYHDASGVLAKKWLDIAGDVLRRVVLIVGKAPNVLELLGSEFFAAERTTLVLTASQ